MQPYSLKDLYTAYQASTPDAFVLYLPRNSDLNEIAKYAPKEQGKKLEVTHYCMSGWSKVNHSFHFLFSHYMALDPLAPVLRAMGSDKRTRCGTEPTSPD